MKKIIIATLTLFSVLSAQAQKNSILLGTDFSLKRVNGYNDEKTNNVTFTPVIAYEVADNWFVGAKTSLSFDKHTYSSDQLLDTKIQDKAYESRIGGFVRYYKPFNETFGIYADLGAGYQQYRSDSKIDSGSPIYNEADMIEGNRVRGYGYYIDFAPALFINFKNNFGLNVSFGGVEWSDTKENVALDYKNYNKSKDFDLTFGKSIHVGVTKKFSF
ncbi:hypothetical protein GFU95_05335 [Apibacter sp. B3889]|uniref:outer membrane beta-barrel protein n=1 Tax=Apibacter TaxID=1778601 RepID=UPI001326B140|nr:MULTISPECIES: outer membrane beta-barrel protein [Apibacter]MXO31567.1 hypothetical protein [Apibacter sp. B2912]MXO34078.1 hypothetical protein [Apibacter sp. B3883]MXO41791.1 hypothetical protein [Apibacter sp. B3889]MXP03361.1 hypothetical protein [Apibacter sp. B3887]MXP07376.1 hypothetical protein [Apibacter sp. B3935]